MSIPKCTGCSGSLPSLDLDKVNQNRQRSRSLTHGSSLFRIEKSEIENHHLVSPRNKLKEESRTKRNGESVFHRF